MSFVNSTETNAITAQTSSMIAVSQATRAGSDMPINRRGAEIMDIGSRNSQRSGAVIQDIKV